MKTERDINAQNEPDYEKQQTKKTLKQIEKIENNAITSSNTHDDNLYNFDALAQIEQRNNLEKLFKETMDLIISINLKIKDEKNINRIGRLVELLQVRDKNTIDFRFLIRLLHLVEIDIEKINKKPPEFSHYINDVFFLVFAYLGLDDPDFSTKSKAKISLQPGTEETERILERRPSMINIMPRRQDDIISKEMPKHNDVEDDNDDYRIPADLPHMLLRMMIDKKTTTPEDIQFVEDTTPLLGFIEDRDIMNKMIHVIGTSKRKPDPQRFIKLRDCFEKDEKLKAFIEGVKENQNWKEEGMKLLQEKYTYPYMPRRARSKSG